MSFYNGSTILPKILASCQGVFLRRAFCPYEYLQPVLFSPKGVFVLQKITSVVFANSRFVLVGLASFRFAHFRLAPFRLAFLRFAKVRSAERRSAPLRSHLGH